MKKLIISLGLIVPTVLFGQVDRSIQPKAAAAPTINIEDSEVFKTANGITVILSENHRLPKVSFNLVTGSTPKVEGKKAGLSEVAGSLIMSGTTNRSKDVLDNETDMIGANLNADDNSIYLSCLTKHMDAGLSLMTDLLMNANFPQNEVDRIIALNESGLLAAKSDEGTMSRNGRSVANYPKNHPYGEVMTAESLANIDRASIVDYYTSTFTPNGSYLVIVGDITKEEATKAVDNYFSKWKGGAVYKAELVKANTVRGNRVFFCNKPGSKQSNISITFPVDITPAHEDYLKLKVLNGILGGGAFGNRLMQNLREDKAYTYGCRSNVSISNNGSSFYAGGNFRNSVTDSAIVQILMELERITEGVVNDDELSLTKMSMAGSFARSLERPSTVARFALSIIRNELPKDYYQTYLKQLESITKEDILMVAQKYMTGSNCNIVVVGHEDVIDVLTQFDADGKIEKIDAFGNPKVERIAADITADELLEKYTTVAALGSTGKKLKKKLKKAKSLETVIEVSNAQLPQPGKLTEVWMNTGAEGTKFELMGMTYFKSYFTGEAGGSSNMQTGAEEMSAEDIAAKKKSQGFIPEMNYAANGMQYELLGIEDFDGKMCYALALNDGKDESINYYDKETFYKVASSRTVDVEGEAVTMITTFSNYLPQDGFLFPNSMSIPLGPGFTMDGKVISITVNAKVDLESFK